MMRYSISSSSYKKINSENIHSCEKDPTVYLHFCSWDHQEFYLPLFSASSVVSVLAVQSWSLFVAYFPDFQQLIWIIFLHLLKGSELLQLMTSFLKSAVETEDSSPNNNNEIHFNSQKSLLLLFIINNNSNFNYYLLIIIISGN